MRIILISDAWHPQINGIVTTLIHTRRELEKQGHQVELISPDRFRTWPCPGYPDVRLAFGCGPRLWPLIEAFQPDAIHLATEGPVGFAARRYCRRKGYAYTSSFHSHYPEYLKLRIGLPLSVGYGYLRWFHGESRRVLVATESLMDELAGKGWHRLAHCSMGVDTERFRPADKAFIDDERPIFLYAGRVAIEKNIEAFLRLELPGSKYIVGDGPQRAELQGKYPGVRFVGYQKGETLARYMAAADVFVFPSLTDTFGLVILEALACGVPVAAYPVPGPRDILWDDRVGVLANDLQQAALQAWSLHPHDCRRHAQKFSWEECSRQFVNHLTPMVAGANRYRGTLARVKGMSNDQDKITVYYDGACPRCVRDRRSYEKWAGGQDGQVCWFDITGQEDALREIGIDPHKALTELHVRDENGRILSELDAYILLLGKVPVLKPLAWLIGMPVIRPRLSRLYRWLVIRRLRKSGRL